MSKSHRLQRSVKGVALLLLAIVSINSILAFIGKRNLIESTLTQVLSGRAESSAAGMYFCIENEARSFVPKRLLEGDFASLPIAGTDAVLMYEPMVSATSVDEESCYWTFVDRYLISAARLGVVHSTKARNLKKWHIWAIYLGDRWIVVSEETVLY